MFFSLNIKPEQVSLKNAIFTPLVTFEKLAEDRQCQAGGFIKATALFISTEECPQLHLLPPTLSQAQREAYSLFPAVTVTGIPFAKKEFPIQPIASVQDSPHSCSTQEAVF